MKIFERYFSGQERPKITESTLITAQEQRSFGKFEANRDTLVKGIVNLRPLLKEKAQTGSISEQAMPGLSLFLAKLGNMRHEFDNVSGINLKAADEFQDYIVETVEGPLFHNDTERGLVIFGVVLRLEKLIGKLVEHRNFTHAEINGANRALDYFMLFLRAEKDNEK